MRKKVLFPLFTVLLVCTGFVKDTKDNYTLDVGHTYIGFDVERFMVGEVSGRFNDFSANISMKGDDVTTLQLDATIKVASLDSNNKTRDGHLKGKMWLDAQAHPEIRFVSSSVHKNGDKVSMKGNFTIKGVTKEVEFPIVVSGPFVDPTKNKTIGIKADFSINRFDYGIKFSKRMDNGSLFIGKEVKIKIRALAIKK
ncbi:YceI family protein [Pseudotenacibaculum haliotis]|uniref:YceI family protein n=1 Tax=Pseudotenacibaculum haliotis TaxID=1862138 RepID=A0ABW5LZS3_9FLAO